MRIRFNIPSNSQPQKSSAFDEMHQKAYPAVSENRPDLKKKYKELNCLFNKPLSSYQAKKILIIWDMVKYVSRMTEQINVSNDEDIYLNGISGSIEALKSDLTLWVNHGTTFQINAVILEKEPNINIYLKILDDLAAFVTICRTNKKFGKGSEFNSDYIKKFGVFTLFRLGFDLELIHAKRNSHLVKFVEIITDLAKQQIYKYYQQYNIDEFNLMLKDNKLLLAIHSAYRAVLDPYADLRYPARLVINYPDDLIFKGNHFC